MPLWGVLNSLVWLFGLRAVVELRAEFGSRARTWTTLVWAVSACLLMELAMLLNGATHWPAATLVSVASGTASGVLMWLAVRFLIADLGMARPVQLRYPHWDRIAAGTAVSLTVGAFALSHIAPDRTSQATGVLHIAEGAVWLVGSLSAILLLAVRRHAELDHALYRPYAMAAAFAAALVQASLTPISRLSGTPIPEGVGSLAGTLFILTIVTTFYGTLIRVRGHRLAEALRQVHEAQEQLFTVEKLVAVGTLAAGAAHDFNNSLTVIAGHAELALDDQTLTPDTRGSLSAILAASANAKQIASNLLHLARRHAPARASSTLREALEGPLVSLAKDLKRRKIQVVTAFVAHPPITVDPGVVSQVCLNLYLNARDAMEQRGGMLDVSLTVSGSEVVVAVRDTGTGVPASFLPNLFKPLQTTKGDKGTGLGLAGSRAMIEAAGGRLSFTTEEGVGSTFRVHLPVAVS